MDRVTITRRDSAVLERRKERVRGDRTTLVVGAIGALTALLGVWQLAAPLIVLCLALGLRSRSPGSRLALPTAAVLAVAAALVCAELLALLHWRGLSEAWAARGLLALAAAGLALVPARSWTRGRETPERVPLGLASASNTVVTALPALVLSVFGVVLYLMPTERQVQWFLEGDNPRHLIYVADEWHIGYLDYSLDPYPHAWHSVLALLWGASDPALDAGGLISLLELNSSMTWLLFVMLTLATGLLARELAERIGLSTRWSGVAALGAGASTLSVPFLGTYMANGFEASILAALCLAVAAYELAAHRGSGRAVLATAACLAVMANNWQLMLPESILAFGAAVLLYLRRGGSKKVAMCTGLIAAGASAPGLLAVLRQTGLDHALEAGVAAPLPMTWLGAAAASSVIAMGLGMRRRDLAMATASAMVIGALVSAIAVAAAVGIPPSQYYPSKMLWKATLLGVPLVWVAIVTALDRLRGRWSLPAFALSGAVVACLALWWMAQPAASFMGKWSSVSAPKVLAAVRPEGAAAAEVVWTGDREDDTVARILLDFYRVGQTRERTLQHPLSIAEECALLAKVSQPVVLSTEAPGTVEARYRCATGLRTIHVARTPLN